MVIPKAVHVDFLDVSGLRGPLLDSYYGSAIQKEDVGVIAREIMRRYLAKVPRDTGNLASTARVTYHRAKGHRDKRWESEFSVGGPRAPYVVPLEQEKHYLDDVLREMGFSTGDKVDGPQGRVAPEHREPPDRKKVYEVSDAQHRRNVAKSQLEFAARSHDPAAERRRSENELTQERGEVDAMIADLARRRPNTKAEKDAYANLNRARFFTEDSDIRARAGGALEAHRSARAAKGLEARPPGAPTAPDEIAKAEKEAQVGAHKPPERERKFGTDPESGYEQLRPLVEKVQKSGRRPGSKAMERDVAELRAATEKIRAERGAGEASLGSTALTSYEMLKQARQERDEFLQRRPYFRD